MQTAIGAYRLVYKFLTVGSTLKGSVQLSVVVFSTPEIGDLAMMKRLAFSLAILALVCGAGTPGNADPLKIKPGVQFDFSATACVTEDAGRAIVAAGKKTGSGYSTFMALKAQGICGRVETPATLVRVLDTFTDVAIGPVALAELTVTNGTDTKTLYGLMTPSEIDLSSI